MTLIVVALADGWKLQVTENPPATWLFHLDEDATESTNLADVHPERVAAMRELLAEHNAEQAEPLWPSVIQAPVNIDKTLLEPDEPDDEYIYWPN